MSSPLIQIVVAYSRNRIIGRDNGLPWRLPSDLAHFKAVTLGHPIVMGRKTWDSLGRALPGRANLVVSRNPSLVTPGAQCHTSLDAALAACSQADKISIIGGGELYRLALPQTDRILATEVHTEIDGDTWFPELDPATWQETARQPQAAENGLEFDFVTYERRDRHP